MTQPTVSKQGSSSPKDRLQSHQVHLTMLQYYTCMQYTVIHVIHMNLSTEKWAQWDKTQSRELLGLFMRVCIALCTIVAHNIAQNTTTTPQSFYGPFFRVHPGEPVPEENFWTLWCNGDRHTENPARRHSIRTNQCPPPPSPAFLQAGCPCCRPTNSVKALKAASALGLGRRR